MYSKRSPTTSPAGIDLPYISMPASWGIAPSTGISLLRRYSSMPSSTCRFGMSLIPYTGRCAHVESAMSTVELYGIVGLAPRKPSESLPPVRVAPPVHVSSVHVVSRKAGVGNLIVAALLELQQCVVKIDRALF